MKLIERPKNLFQFQEWFDTHLKDHYAVHKDDLVRVYARTPEEPLVWVTYEKKDDIPDSHQAYLIKSSIEPIKKDTAEDVLREIVSCYGKDDEKYVLHISEVWELIERARRILEQDDE